MIDWLSFVAPCRHERNLFGGAVLSVNEDGKEEWHTMKRKGVRGSWDTSIQIRTVTYGVGPRTFLEISGNPVKWFQGHNLWGTDDLPALVVAMLESLVARGDLGLCPTVEDRSRWLAGDIALSRVDVTDTFHLRTLSQVLEWLRAAEQTAHLAHRGRGQLVKGSTLYFGKNSRRWALKLYAKGQEIQAKGHGQESILLLPAAQAWAERSLRAELVLRSMELKRIGRALVSDWLCEDDMPSTVATERLLYERLGTMTMTTTTKLDDAVIESLFPAQRTAYLAWVAGADLRAAMSNGSFYRLRAKLLPHGIDIATLQSKEVSNVVPLVRILEAKPAGIPEWAIGTPLYFEPTPIRRIA